MCVFFGVGGTVFGGVAGTVFVGVGVGGTVFVGVGFGGGVVETACVFFGVGETLCAFFGLGEITCVAVRECVCLMAGETTLCFVAGVGQTVSVVVVVGDTACFGWVAGARTSLLPQPSWPRGPIPFSASVSFEQVATGKLADPWLEVLVRMAVAATPATARMAIAATAAGTIRRRRRTG